VFCSVLGTFIYDPLVEWQKRGFMADSKNKETGEVTNEEVMYYFKNEGFLMTNMKIVYVVQLD